MNIEQPLAGRRVLVPRADGNSAVLQGMLSGVGATVDAVPLISIEPPDDPAQLDAAVLALAAGDYQWVGFASANAVTAVLERAAQLGLEPAVPADTNVAAIGAATASVLRAAGLPVDLQPSGRTSAASLVEIWPRATLSTSTVLLPSSSIGLPTLETGLTAKGYQVDRVAAYSTRTLPVPETVRADLAAGRYFAVLLTSPSIVAALADALIGAPELLLGFIGQTTAAAAGAAGLPAGFVAAEPTMSALVAGLIANSRDE